jgi:hypothetical protein
MTTTTRHLVESMIADWLEEEYTDVVLAEEGFVTIVKNGTRGYLPKRKKRAGDDWKDMNIAHFPTEKAAKDWLKKDQPGAVFIKEEADLNEIFVTIVKNGTRGYLPKWKKRSGDDWKSFNIAHFPSENEARAWVKKDHSDVMFVREEADLNESDYKVMHKTFTDAVSAAKEKAVKAGYTIDDDEWFRKVSSGPRKPGTDKTNRYSLELLTKKGGPAKKMLNFQVYNTGGAYELNAYIN